MEAELLNEIIRFIGSDTVLGSMSGVVQWVREEVAKAEDPNNDHAQTLRDIGKAFGNLEARLKGQAEFVKTNQPGT